MNFKDREIVIFIAGLIIAFEVWQSTSINDLKMGQAVQTTQIESISKAVNHVDSEEQTLREMVAENQKTLVYIKSKVGDLHDQNDQDFNDFIGANF